jgi:hypothetical protein
MKKNILVMGMLVMLLAAGFAGAADDVNVDVENTNTTTATGGNANAEQTQDQTQQQQQEQNQSLTDSGNSSSNSSANNSLKDSGNSNVKMNTPRPFLAAPGFVTGIVPGTVENGREWHSFCPSVGAFSSEKIHRMSGGSGWFSGNDVTVTEIEEARNPVSSLTCQMVWPATFDGVGAEVVVSGDTNSTQAAAVGLAMAECIDRGFPAIAMVVVDKFEGETKGRSIGLSGASSTIADTSGVAFVGGGMLGTNKTRINDYKMVRAMCLTSLELVKVEEKKVVVQVCNPDEIWVQINELKRKIALCTQFCFNNLQLRSMLGEKYIDLAVCTGDNKYYNFAITEGFEVAERNFKFGKDIKAHHAEATAIMQQVYFLQAGCLNQVYGIKTATDFANRHHLEKFPQKFEK